MKGVETNSTSLTASRKQKNRRKNKRKKRCLFKYIQRYVFNIFIYVVIHLKSNERAFTSGRDVKILSDLL